MLSKAIAEETLQVVVFRLVDQASERNEEYGVGIDQVKEIRSLEGITRVPNSPIHIKGVTNLRGSIISVIDVKRLLDFPPSEEVRAGSRILVVEIDGITRGLLVDEVDQVMRISANDVDSAPAGTLESTQYVKGIAKTQGKLIILLDLQKLFELISNKNQDFTGEES